MSGQRRFLDWFRANKRKALACGVVLLLLRAWPLVGIITGLNLKTDLGPIAPEASFIPPSTLPVELRSGCSHPHFDFQKLLVEVLFKPRATRHGHVFRRDDPALASGQATELISVLSDPASYQPWGGGKMCGGFHADWYLRWANGLEAIVCAGCGEILLYRNGQSIRCDLSDASNKRILELTRTPDTR